MSRRHIIAVTACAIVASAHGCTVRDIVEVVVGSVDVQPDSVTVLEGQTQQLTAEVRDESGEALPQAGVIWSSDNPSVFSIDASTGEGQALGPGLATIWATRSDVRGSGTIVVEPGPRMVVSNAAISFQGSVGGSAPSPVDVRITNGGGGSVSGISASVEYSPGDPGGWLSLALDRTSTPAVLTVSALLGSLGEGEYHATLVLASPDAMNSPVTIPVEAVVTLDTPVIGVDPARLEFQMETGGAPPVAQTVRITNEGGGVLSGLQALPLYSGVSGWLSTTLANTTAPTELLVEITSSGLSTGTHTAEIRISSPGALNTPVALDVILTVPAGAASPEHSTATVPAGTVGLPTNIVVQARDAQDNPVSSGGAVVVLTVSGANRLGPITAVDTGDGTYTASYVPMEVGTDNVAITMDGTSLGDSPFSSVVQTGSASPEHSTANVPNGRTFRITRITVQARDVGGNPLSEGGATVVVTVTGANNAGPITATDMGDGKYTASYLPFWRGTDTVAITMNGIPMSGSPFTSQVK